MQRFRWWQTFGRNLFHLRLSNPDGYQALYAVDIRHWGNQGSGEVKADLYRDGRRYAESKLPAAFPLKEGGIVEVAMSGFGLKRCHYITANGAEHQLIPDPRSAEGRRARLDREHPSLSRGIGFLSATFLVIGLLLLLLQIAGPISEVPPLAERFGTFESPVQLPLWLNIALGLGAVLGSMERALRLRCSWLDSAGN
ncbi:hypothetical protein BJ994_003348 [Arthrobacter pigmenti]|uniref:Uncharacterized protein n=1 Tax=Arthrobacter pigmenti TaxID=271432 RepID=A0A846RUT2_9MICC|nr:hypothetical protein [Arthrobacter pigmenti]NJC24272.1 hypothetical protein [Arthrobacter pigmenti]